MRKFFLGLAFALAALPAAAANIDAKDAAAHVGETVSVEGVLSNVHKTSGKTIILDIGGLYPDNVFSAVILKHEAPEFPDLTPLVGKKLAITGKIELYHDKPQIVLKTPDQVQVEQ